jgi:hypothetical protein
MDKAAVAATAAMAHAAGISGALVNTANHDEQTMAVAMVVTLVADPTANLAKAEQTQNV